MLQKQRCVGWKTQLVSEGVHAAIAEFLHKRYMAYAVGNSAGEAEINIGVLGSRNDVLWEFRDFLIGLDTLNQITRLA
ncbi:MAG: hypothetical protein ACLSAC_06715 [Enterocloster bolteae]